MGVFETGDLTLVPENHDALNGASMVHTPIILETLTLSTSCDKLLSNEACCGLPLPIDSDCSGAKIPAGFVILGNLRWIDIESVGKF